MTFNLSHCHKLLKDIKPVRPLLSCQHTAMLVHSVITSRLDYFNSVFYNISQYNMKKLQKVQNSAARIVARKHSWVSISGTLRELHWLIKDRIENYFQTAPINI